MVIVTESELNILDLFNPGGTRLPHSKARKWLQNAIRSHTCDSPKPIKLQGKIFSVEKITIETPCSIVDQYQIAMKTSEGKEVYWPKDDQTASEDTCPDWLWEALQEINGTRINSSNWK